MDIQAIAFDVNGTLIEIRTEEHREDIFRAVGHFLTYQGIDLRRVQVRELYFQILKDQQKSSPEEYPEFDAVGIWQKIIEDHMSDFTRALPAEKLEQMPLFLAEMYRGISRRRLCPYPYVREVITVLHDRYPLALVTDAQSAYCRGELEKAGLLGFFDPVIVSGDFGYRKPDKRLFESALSGMGIAAEHTLFVGNDMHRDIFGAQEVGMKTVMFDSDQGTKEHLGCTPDYTINDYRELLGILGLPELSTGES